ncbi:unnamed protein product [Rhizophagus irregularis]|nr:unnamed protein product [Rhizophagus irregularis]
MNSLIKVFSNHGHLIRTEVSFSRDLSYDEGPNQWSLSDKQKLIPLYDILDDDIKSRIQDLSTDKIFNERYMSRSGFLIFLEDDKDSEEIKTDFDVVWQIIGKPKNVGYFGKDNRDIKVLSAQSRLIRLPKEKATYPIPPIYFKEELPPGTIIVTFIDYALHGGSILDVVVKSFVDTTAKTKAHKEHEEIEMSGDGDEDKKDENEDDEDKDEKKDEDEKDEEKKEDKEDNKDYKEDKKEDQEDNKEEEEDKEEEEEYDEENGGKFPNGFVRFFVLAYAIIPNKEEKFTAFNTEVFIRGEARQFSWKHVGHELGEETVTHITENIFEKRTSYLEYSKYIMSGKRIDLEIINHLVVDTTAKTKAHKEHEEIEMSGDGDEDKKDENEDDEDKDEKKDEDEKDEEKKEDKEDNKDYKEDKKEDQEDNKEEEEDKEEEEEYDEENGKISQWVC